MLDKEIIGVYTENDTKSIKKQNAALLTIKAYGTYTYHSALNG
jgi:hypothetical protein